MSGTVNIALYGWVLVVLLLFSLIPARRAVIAAFLGGWLFLPEATISLAGLPDISKVSVTSIAVLAGIGFFDAERYVKFKPSVIDIPMVVWCLIPIASSLENELGIYDGFSFAFSNTLLWGAPYFVGRLYFDSLEALRELAVGIAIAGLVYMPFCIFEMKMSPQLHRMVYGYHPSTFAMTHRWGGFRPTAFMTHGLMTSMWMTSAAVVLFWLWHTKALRKVRNVPAGLLALMLVVTAIMMRSTGAALLLIGGIGFLMTMKMTRSLPLAMLVVLLTPAYMAVRATGIWDGSHLIDAASQISTERAASLEWRIDAENLLTDRAMESPIVGWAGWGRWRAKDEYGDDLAVSDGMWIIALGRHGLIGLVAFMGSLLIPVVLTMRRLGVRCWSHAAFAPLAALAVMLVLFSMDCLFNAMPGPPYMLTAGALGTFYLVWPQTARAYAQAWQQAQMAQIAAMQQASTRQAYSA